MAGPRTPQGAAFDEQYYTHLTAAMANVEQLQDKDARLHGLVNMVKVVIKAAESYHEGAPPLRTAPHSPLAFEELTYQVSLAARTAIPPAVPLSHRGARPSALHNHTHIIPLLAWSAGS